MTSSYRDPNITAALAYQAEQEQRRKAQEQPSFIDVAGRTALGLGVAALAGAGIARGLRRNAMKPVSVEDLGATAARAEESVRRAARGTTAPPPSRPAPPAGVARQQAAEEFTRQARAERPVGVQQISIQDLGPTFRTPSSAENKATLAFLEDVVLPTEQALTRPRLPAASFSPADYLTQKGYVEAAATGTPYSASEVAQLSRRPLVDAADRLLEDTDLLKRVEAEEAALVNVQPEIRGEQSRQQAQVRRALSAQADEVIAGIRSEPVGSLVATQQARTGFNVDQAINALDAAEDQQTGRVKIQLQRNEDLDMGQVEMLEDRASQQPNLTMAEDGPINSVAVQLPDGLPVDQAEGRLIPGDEGYEDRLLKTIYQQELEARPPALTKEDMERNIQNSLNRGFSVQLPSKLPAEGVRSLSSQELADVAKADMIARRQEVAARGLIPGTLRFERALAESWASKPGFMPGTEEFRQRIALPRVIRSAVQAASADPLDPLGGLKERTVVNIGPNAEISSTAAGTAIRGASPVYDVAEPKVATRQIYGAPDALVPGAPDELMPDRPGIETAFQQIISQPQLPERTDPYALKRLKGGSPGIGVYGPELSYVPGAVGKATGEYSAAAGRTPGYVPAWILKQEQTPFSKTSTEGLNRALAKSGKSGTLAITSELGRREIAKENLVKSELLRRANIEGRDPQMILKQFGIGT
jgi:hypothetical protein